jgi:lipopolysaccharide/colanic/teichoic acid biosynthesis glycosyltransferase
MMFDFDSSVTADPSHFSKEDARSASRKWLFHVYKRAFDLLGAMILLGALVPVAIVLLLVNPFCNRGPLFYAQQRMGLGCKPFRAYKFRTMLPEESLLRGAFDQIETHRITRFGQMLRKSRIDELPQAINVLRGDMSLIGPRPDYYEHACIYLAEVPGYRDRHTVKPGITGLAQTEVGYAAGMDAIRRKVAADLAYIRNRSIRLDIWITFRTIAVVLGRKGA